MYTQCKSMGKCISVIYPKLFATSSSFLLAPLSTSRWSYKNQYDIFLPILFFKIPEDSVGFLHPGQAHHPCTWTKQGEQVQQQSVCLRHSWAKNLTYLFSPVQPGAPGPFRKKVIFFWGFCIFYLSIMMLVSDSRDAALVVNSVVRRSSLSWHKIQWRETLKPNQRHWNFDLNILLLLYAVLPS